MSSGGVSRSSMQHQFDFYFSAVLSPTKKVVLGTHVVYDVIGKNITSNFY
jgi:hypothetical protein